MRATRLGAGRANRLGRARRRGHPVTRDDVFFVVGAGLQRLAERRPLGSMAVDALWRLVPAVYAAHVYQSDEPLTDPTVTAAVRELRRGLRE
jgi:hypothetical protein